MADWTVISSLATGAGTLALAAATFAAVRSSNRSARLAEQAMEEQRRPVLVHSRAGDPDETIPFRGGQRVTVSGGGAVVEVAQDVVYLALGLRNVGAGIAVLQAWHVFDGDILPDDNPTPDVAEFRQQRRHLYIAGGDVGIWQGALRDAEDPQHPNIVAAAEARRPFAVALLYTDQTGGQRTISRFGVLPEDDRGWIAAVGSHEYLDVVAPR
jgi:hypothetical protein